MKRAAVRRAVPVAICLIAGALAGCAGGSESFFTSSSPSSGSTLGNLLAFNTTKPGPVPPAAADKEPPLQCPQIEVLDGTAAIRVYNGADQSSGNVRYQYSMGDVARECSRSGNQIVIKVGVEGRVLLGPVGAPGSFSIPVRIAVRRESDQKAAAAKFYQVPATVAAGDTQGEFTLVADPLTVPYTQAHADEDYTILVGFDEHGAAPAGKSAAKPRKKRAGR